MSTDFEDELAAAEMLGETCVGFNNEEILGGDAPSLDEVRAGHSFIKRGMSGDSVKYVQKAVGADADGVFGPKTESAVKTYQSSHGLDADGVVGHKTLAVIDGQSGLALIDKAASDWVPVDWNAAPTSPHPGASTVKSTAKKAGVAAAAGASTCGANGMTLAHWAILFFLLFTTIVVVQAVVPRVRALFSRDRKIDGEPRLEEEHS